MMVAVMAQFWDDFVDPLKVTFDGESRTIIVNPQYDAVSVREDIYSAYKRWVQRRDNSKYLVAMRTTGGDPVGTGIFSGDIYFLVNNWRIYLDHTFEIDGVIFSDDYPSPYIQAPDTLLVSNKVSALVQTVAVGGGTGGTGVSAQEVWNYPTRQLTSYPAQLTTGEIVSAIDNTSTQLQSIKSTVQATQADVLTIPGGVWDEPVSAHLTPGSAGEAAAMTKANTENTVITTVTTLDMVNTVMKYSNNRTKIDTTTNQLIIYDVDNVTPIQIFNLRDRNGLPSTVESMERIPTM